MSRANIKREVANPRYESVGFAFQTNNIDESFRQNNILRIVSDKIIYQFQPKTSFILAFPDDKNSNIMTVYILFRDNFVGVGKVNCRVRSQWSEVIFWARASSNLFFVK